VGAPLLPALPADAGMEGGQPGAGCPLRAGTRPGLNCCRGWTPNASKLVSVSGVLPSIPGRQGQCNVSPICSPSLFLVAASPVGLVWQGLPWFRKTPADQGGPAAHPSADPSARTSFSLRCSEPLKWQHVEVSTCPLLRRMVPTHRAAYLSSLVTRRKWKTYSFILHHNKSFTSYIFFVLVHLCFDVIPGFSLSQQRMCFFLSVDVLSACDETGD